MRFTCFTPVRLLRRSIAAGVLLAVAAAAGMPSANAQSLTNTWNGGAGNGNWSTGANWSSGTAPLTSGTNQLRFAGSTQTTSTNSQASLPVNTLNFLSGAASFTLSGSSIQIMGGGGPGIQNLSAADQVINNDLVLSVNSNYHATGGGTLFLNGNISGASSFNATNGGNIVVGGSNGTNTVNAWIVRQGLLKMNSANALGTGALQLSSASGTADAGVVGLTFDLNRPLGSSGTGTLRWNVGNGGFAAFGATRTVTLSGTPSVTGTWGATTFIANDKSLLLSHTTADATLVFANGINLGGSGTTRTIEVHNGSADVDGRMSNTLSGSANLQKTGLGTLELTGTNTYLGTTSIDAGRLLVNGNQSSATGAMTVGAAATLGGSGTIGSSLTTVSGFLTPGSSGTNAGLLTASALTLDSTSLTRINVDGQVRGSSYDAVNVSNALAYGGALQFLMPTVVSGTYDIFDMTSSSGDLTAVSGTFGGTLLNFAGPSSGVWTANLGSGTTATFTQSTGELVIVPEPATLALAGLGIGLAAVAAWRRNRRVA